MKASETKLQPIIEGTKQYVVPLFQRPYSWDKREWKILWDDLEWFRHLQQVERGAGDPLQHGFRPVQGGEGVAQPLGVGVQGGGQN